MTLTKESVDIESLLEDSLPCESGYNECTKEADFLIRKTYCSCCAFECAQHTKEWIERLKNWHNTTYGIVNYSRCGECHTQFEIPRDAKDCYIVIPI